MPTAYQILGLFRIFTRSAGEPSLAENDADPVSGMPVVLTVEQEFKRRYDAINGALRTIRTYLEN